MPFPTSTISRFLVLLALVWAGAVHPPAQAAQAEVRIGVLAYQGEQAAAEDWAPLAAALDRALPGRHFVLRYFGLQDLWHAVENEEVDFVITHGGQYVALESAFGASRIATLENPRFSSPGKALGSVVVVRAERQDLQQLADLAGQRLAAVAPEAFGGYLVALRELHDVGVELDDLGSVDFVGFPMQKVLQELLDGRADAATLRACLLEELAAQGSIDPTRFRVLAPRAQQGFPCQLSSRLYPDWPFVSLHHTDRALAKAVATALLAMAPLPGGVAWTVPADYQEVHALYRELQLGPYAYLRDTTLLARLKRFWWVVVGLFLILAAWVVHTVRVEYQVAARTKDLRKALAERDAAQARILAQQDEAEHLSRLSILGELSSTLAHELTQPLASIANFAHSMVRRLDSGRYTPELLAGASRDIASEAERAGGIVQRIRSFSKKRVAIRQDCVPGELVQEAVELFCSMLAPPPQVTLVDRLPRSTVVEGDPLQLQQVLLNLMKNAWDAMQALPPAQRRMDLEIGGDGGQCTIRVRDYGCGLDDAQMARLFESFFTTKPDGLGLGLSICKSIIEAHAGRLVAMRPDEGPGMCFTVTLPAHERTA